MMGASSGSDNNHNEPPSNMLPPRWSHPSLFMASSGTLASNPHQLRESAVESSSSRPTDDIKTVKKENAIIDQPVIRRFSDSHKVSLQDIARERVDVISEKMLLLPDDYLQELKMVLREILEGSGGSHYREDLFLLQKLVQTRSDLNTMTLIKAHRTQLKILVAINSGIQAFLHPNITLSQSALIEVFVYRRCRNIACQNLLPAEECKCNICSNKKGFCNLCMCTICTKFDFDVNTCRWIGCDSCSHWTHTDCAIREKQVCMGTSVKGGFSSPQMVFRCRACSRTSELFGWVNDVFQHCAPSWTREHLIKELVSVSRIFGGSQDSRGRQLFWKSDELLEKLKGGMAEATACGLILTFFQELRLESPKRPDPSGSEDACNKICEVVQEAIEKMEMVSNEKMEMVAKARLELENCDRELEEKVREIAELKVGRHEKKQQIEELESIVRLKEAEADMFQMKADEATREADELRSIAVAAKSKRSEEEEYAARYLKLRLSEAEAERMYLFEKIKLEERG